MGELFWCPHTLSVQVWRKKQQNRMQLRRILTLSDLEVVAQPASSRFLVTNSNNARLLLFPHQVEINAILHLVWTVLLQLKEQTDECECVIFTLDHSCDKVTVSLNEQEKLVQQLCGAPVFV